MIWSLVAFCPMMLALFVSCQSTEPVRVPVVTQFYPAIAQEGQSLTLSTVFNVTLANRTCKPTDIQVIKRVFRFDVADMILADFNRLLVPDYRLNVSLDTSSKYFWVYNLTVQCVTRLNTNDMLIFGGSWDCPGIDIKQQCFGLPVKVDFASIDALPVCASEPTAVNATAREGQMPPLPAPRFQGSNSNSRIREDSAGINITRKPPKKLCQSAPGNKHFSGA